jgi:hypothetical protein
MRKDPASQQIAKPRGPVIPAIVNEIHTRQSAAIAEPPSSMTELRESERGRFGRSGFGGACTEGGRMGMFVVVITH